MNRNDYEQDLNQMEHHYQNHVQQEHQKQQLKQKKSNNSQLQRQARPSLPQPPQNGHQNQQKALSRSQSQSQSHQSNSSPPSQNNVHYRITRNPSITSSIMGDSDKRACSFFIIVLAVICQVLAIVTICITFIFPFWALFKISLPDGTLLNNGQINATNTESKISIVADNTTTHEFPKIKDLDQIKFDMGLWDLRTYRKLKIYDLTNLNIVTENTDTMRWTTGDSKSNSFISMYLSFIGLTSSTFFAVQILEILHLIFTLLTFCATAVTLCLCTNKKASLAWYLVCYLLCLVALLLGMSVIMTLVAWQTSNMPTVTSTQTLSLLKDFGFCFWLSVVVQALMLFASFFILTYIIVAAVSLYQKHKEETKRLAASKQNGFTSISRIPRLHVNNTPTSSSNSNGEPDSPRSQNQPINAFSNLQQMPDNTGNSNYVFYTGHGNFHKPSNSQKQLEEYEPPNEMMQPPPEHLVNYSLMLQNQNRGKNMNKINDQHPYSNVQVEQINHAYNNGPQ